MDNSCYQTISYTQFGERLKQRIHGKRIPLSGSIELNLDCNLICKHCYLGDLRCPAQPQPRLSLADYDRIFDQIAEAGCLWLLLTGGEPLLRKDFVEIYLLARQKGFIITLFTNGTLVSDRIADLLAEFPPYRIEITIYGMSAGVYEAITGIKGSHVRCLQGIQRLVARHVPLGLKTVAMTLNQHELAAMHAYAADLGLTFRHDSILNAGLDGSSAPSRFRLPVDQVIKFDQITEQSHLEFTDFYHRYQGAQVDQRLLYQCGAGITSFHIDPTGRLSLCMMSRSPDYDLLAGSFNAGWNTTLERERMRPASSTFACRACSLRSTCSYCPGWSLTEAGDVEGPVEYLCEISRARALAFGYPASTQP